MSYYFTSQFLTLLKSGWSGGNVQMYLFPQSPSLLTGEGDVVPTTTAYAGINKITTLVQSLGWGSTYVAGPVLPVTVTTNINGTTRNVAEIALSSRFQMAVGTATTPVMAIGFAIDNSTTVSLDDLMFVTDTLSTPPLMMHALDGIAPARDATLADKRVLFYWDTVPPGSDAAVLPHAVEGKLLMEKTTPPFETARTQHIWVYPQRLNLIPNPSFELATNYWRSNGSIARFQDSPPGGGSFCGRVTGTRPLILESDIFPLRYGRRREEGLTMQLQARGAGILKIGLIAWEADYRISGADWGKETLRPKEKTVSWLLGGSGFTHIRTLRYFGEAVAGMLRLEFKPYDNSITTGVLDVDQVCVEPGIMPGNFNDWPYFDGATTYGARQDFSWYGGTSFQHASYSCWYNMRNSTFGRLFAWKVDASTPLTDDEASLQGLAYQWVPAGTPVHGHLDVLYPDDPMWNEPRALVPYTGPILAYRTEAAPSLQNVISPWP